MRYVLFVQQLFWCVVLKKYFKKFHKRIYCAYFFFSLTNTLGKLRDRRRREWSSPSQPMESLYRIPKPKLVHIPLKQSSLSLLSLSLVKRNFLWWPVEVLYSDVFKVSQWIELFFFAIYMYYEKFDICLYLYTNISRFLCLYCSLFLSCLSLRCSHLSSFFKWKY